MGDQIDLIIVGAGPFGLALSAQASQLGIKHLILGKPMGFWHDNMPTGMYLRSACDWHLDPAGIDTIEAFLSSIGKTQAEVEPLSLSFYLSYVDWFQQRKRIKPLDTLVKQIEKSKDGFLLLTEDGNELRARCVVLAPGFRHFAHIPEELRNRLPAGSFSHTCEFVDFSAATNKRYLIVGGRQSAFEWAALLIEAGAKTVHLSHRHESPSFETSDWGWVNPLADAFIDDPNWFRRLSQKEKDALAKRLWVEGRQKIEPWLEKRLANDRVKLWPRSEVASCKTHDGELEIQLSNGEQVSVDTVVLATGYKVDLARLPYLPAGGLINDVEILNGFPVLDDHFQTSVPGLFITSIPATQDFGPFFGFTIAVRASAKLICDAVQNEQSLAGVNRPS